MCAAQRERTQETELNIPAQLSGNNQHTQKPKMTEWCSVEQHDLSALNGE